MKILLIILTVFLITPALRAQEETALPTRILPEGQIITHQGVQYKAFTLEEYKKIGLIYADYILLLRANELTLRLNMEKNYELQVQGLKNLTTTLELDRDYWTARVKEEQEANKRRATFSGLERFGSWALVVIEAIALCTLGIAQAKK